ncbi:uncharacterized protein METZ01_LOCUS479190 [marine metagenome]|uniref:Uncharacterized protein n=1 Tax=marine metagenome TaxID=408172 RepID=A0A383C1M9_9ZZZZ
MRRSAEKQQDEEKARKKARDEEIFLQDRDNRGSPFGECDEQRRSDENLAHIKSLKERDAGQMAEFLGRAKNH